ncbi:MAG: folate family ECF transporter S component [Clostridia bacterium]|nr:folate family ECF transporter S component [Clostridia bacterium]
MTKIRKNILSAMLLAILIILSRFISIKTNVLVISLSFIPIMMSAIWLGPKHSTVIALLGDLLGAILFPFGPYFPGFTVSAGISGFVYGIFLHNKGKEMNNAKLLIKLTISSFIVLVFVNIFITSLWINMLYGKAYFAVMASRAVTQIIMLPIQIITIYILEKFSRPFMKKYLLEEV